jgi:hypothetical protein
MLGFIKKIFSGIVSFLLGLLNSKKSLQGNGYFLELEEKETPKKESKPVAQPPAPATNGAKAKAPEPVATKAVKAPAATVASAPASSQAAPTNNQPVKAEQVELVQTAKGLKAEPAKPAKPAKASADSNGKAAETSTFAPKYLIPSASNSRRRPGANMSSFLDMARQVKTPG